VFTPDKTLPGKNEEFLDVVDDVGFGWFELSSYKLNNIKEISLQTIVLDSNIPPLSG